MDENTNEFSWSGLFFVTSVCSFVFCGIIKLLDGGVPTLFLVAGVMAFFLWIVNGIAMMFAKIAVKKRRPRRKREETPEFIS
jgi:hypothetical protein